MQDQQHGVAAVLPSDLDPLVDPPTLTNRCSTILFGVVISSALATRRWRALRQARPPTVGAATAPATPARMVPIMATPSSLESELVDHGIEVAVWLLAV
jgi:hypothetical protein